MQVAPMAGKGMCAISAGALLCLGAGTGAIAGDGYAGYGQVPVLTKTVRDTETGVRAELRYFVDIPTGGEETVIGDDGTPQILMWDGWTGAFEVEALEGADKVDADFVRAAVVAVCPSVDRAGLARMTIGPSLPGFYQFFIQCPDADKKAAN